MGAVAGCPIVAAFDGDASRCARGRCSACSIRCAAWARGRSQVGAGGRLPLTLQGARDPMPIVYRTPVPSAQIKSAVLLAGLAAPGETTVIENEASRDHTERMLAHFGAEVAVAPRGRAWPPDHARRASPSSSPAPVVVPADPSSAAFPMVAALIVPGSEVMLTDVMTNPLRTGPDHDAARDGRRHRGARCRATMAARSSPISACGLGVARGRGAGGARALDDRRISGAGGRGELCRRHDA